MTVRILDLTQVRTGDRPAWRFTLRLDAAVELRECFARRSRDGKTWAIYGPVRRDHGATVPLATWSPAMREAIADELEIAIALSGVAA